MKPINKTLIYTTIFLLLCSTFQMNKAYSQNKYNENSPAIESDIQFQRIQRGTKLKIRIEKPINSLNSAKGEPFAASIISDVYVRNNVALPSGTTIRGRIGEIKRSTYLSRGGDLGLNFDLVETPIGRQLPIIAQISQGQYVVTDGTLFAGGGYLKALQANLNEGVNSLTNISNYCIKKGLSFGNGYPVIITAPLGVAGGVTVGSFIFFDKSMTALYHKGENVKLNPGDILEITLMQPIDVPLN